MKVDELKNFGFEEKWIEKIKKLKIENFYPPQEEFVKRGLFEKNCIISTPTASGKTLMAMLAIIKTLEEGKKVLYTSPLVALAFEKYEIFKEFFSEYKVAISVSDFDSSDPWLQNYDIIVCTNEKADSLLRHKADWIRDVGLLIVDEIHLLTETSRGPTLEILITKLRKSLKNLKIIGLSATIKNAKEMADWLNAELLESNFRPVKLYQGVAFDSKIEFLDKEEVKLNESFDLEEAIVLDTISKNKQILIFCSTRRSVEALAERLSKIVGKNIGKSDISYLQKIAEEIENVLEVPTQQCKKLANCVKNGVAFHHSGLVGKQRRIIEENFRKGLIKVLVATTTLAAGVDLPAFRVLIREARRYHPLYGSIYIPTLEYYQMIGRAGRPRFDKFGESILLAKDEDEAEELKEKFILGEPEPITSKLASEPALRMHTLALIASDFCKKKKSLLEFFSSTFFAYRYDVYIIEEKIEEIIENLEEWGFIVVENSKIEATRLGKRISELYLDPLTEKIFVDGLKSNKKLTELSVLQLISSSIEMIPLPSIKMSELSEIESIIESNKKDFLLDLPTEDYEYEEFEKSVKMALILKDWINERTEEEILQKYSITPGELYSRIQISDWLLYSLHEISLLLGKKDFLTFLKKLRIRIEKGIKEELIPLVSLEGIGRVRARKLYNSGFKTLEDLRKAPLERLSRIIGEKTAIKIKSQLEGKKEQEEKQATLLKEF
ncbi:MAG: DEAD/DEAH box helicase [Candidatus Aenigmatarchaeota archaeon]